MTFLPELASLLQNIWRDKLNCSKETALNSAGTPTQKFDQEGFDALDYVTQTEDWAAAASLK